MSVGEVAGLIAACALLILVGLLAYPILKLGKVFDETRILVKGVSDETVPLLGEVTTTVSTTNAQLLKVDTITDNATTVTTNAAALTSLFAATAAWPAGEGRRVHVRRPPRAGREPAPGRLAPGEGRDEGRAQGEEAR